MNSNHNGRHPVCVYLGEALAAYAFGNDHPFGPQRHDVFRDALYRQSLDRRVDIVPPVRCDRDILELFHTERYITRVRNQSRFGTGYLDQGDTPAFIGMYEAVCAVAGSVCDAVDRVMSNANRCAFIPIAGLHHARRDTAAGFCVINDCGIAIEYLRARYGIRNAAYVDIDAHHGDGVFYSFEDDPDLGFADLHEDGRMLYPGTGAASETGAGAAKGTKLNIPMPPGAGDRLFLDMWGRVEDYLAARNPDFILLQCGADSIEGDPITHMAYSENSHAYAAGRLCKLAEKYCDGRLVAMGGGGYNHENIAKTWTAVVRAMIHTCSPTPDPA